MSVEGHWGQDLNKRARPGSHDFSIGHHCTATGLQSVPRRGEKILPSEPQKLDSVDLFPVYSLTGETRTKSTLSRPPSWFTSSLLHERRRTMEPMWEGESWLLDWLLRSPVMEQGQQKLASLVLRASSVEEHGRPDYVFWFQISLTEPFQALLLSEETRRGMLDFGHRVRLSPPGSQRAYPLSSEPPVPLPQHGKYYDFSTCSRTQRKAGKHCFQRI